MLLSILICGLPDRREKFFALYKKLSQQIIAQDDNVELLYSLDCGEKHGGLTTGVKRNKLIDAAKGKYLCFVDDDDDIPDYYIRLICENLKANEDTDCLGMVGIMRGPTGVEAIFKHSIQFKEWFDDGKIYYRCPNHLNPVKTDLAKKVRFPDITIGEDADYSKRLFPYLKTEINIETPLYYYLTRFRFDKPPIRNRYIRHLRMAPK